MATTTTTRSIIDNDNSGSTTNKIGRTSLAERTKVPRAPESSPTEEHEEGEEKAVVVVSGDAASERKKEEDGSKRPRRQTRKDRKAAKEEAAVAESDGEKHQRRHHHREGEEHDEATNHATQHFRREGDTFKEGDYDQEAAAALAPLGLASCAATRPSISLSRIACSTRASTDPKSNSERLSRIYEGTNTFTKIDKFREDFAICSNGFSIIRRKHLKHPLREKSI